MKKLFAFLIIAISLFTLASCDTECPHLIGTKEVIEPTCDAEGYSIKTCSLCGYEYKVDLRAPKGHTLKAEITEPTCTKEGYTVFSCDCGYSYKGDIKVPTQHDFFKEVLRPSIAKTGKTTYTCGVCEFTYDTDYVWYSEIFSGARGDGEGILAYGVDVSFYNEDVDFEALKAAGIEFVIIRAGSSARAPDVMFEEHYRKARAAGLDVGCYFYSYATTVTEAMKDAELLLELIEGKTFEYPVYFDMEDESQKALSTDRRMDMCYIFCEVLIENGYFPGVYANKRWLENYFNKEELCTYFDVWYARYPKDSAGSVKEPVYFEDWNDYELSESRDYGMWQFTDSGAIDGIDDFADINIVYKNYPEIIKKYGYNGYDN